MANFAANPAEQFAATATQIFYDKAVAPEITHDDYEGEIKKGGDRVNILTLAESQGLQTYTGSNLTLGSVTESEGQLVADQQKAYYFGIKSWDKFKSYVENPESNLMQQKAGQLSEAIDTHVLGLYGDVAAGNRVGTDYTTGTVAVAATTGVVTGTGTTFTAAMVGKGFKAAGHTKWYRVKTYTSATSITIEDDKDDETSAYTGGAISAGATYTIEAATPFQVSKTTIYAKIVALREKLNKAKAPREGRWLVVPSEIETILLQADEFIHATPQGDEVVKNGLIGKIAGFMVHTSEQVAGDNTNGFHIMAGHKLGIAFGMAFAETGIEDLIGNFGKAYKGLNVWGAKVTDERRKFLAEGFWYV